MTYIETPIPIECIDPHTLDKKMIVETMAEAIAKAFDGYLTYVKEVKEWYKFTQTANGLVGIPASSAEFIVETFAASKSIQASDSNKLLRSLSDVNVTVTIPKDITVKMPITIEQAGNGSVLIEAQTDVTINGTAYNTAGQYSFIQIVPVAPNIYTIVGGGTTGGGYIHPTTHPASIIEETSEKRFVSDSEKTTWNGKAAGDHGHSEATTVNAGFMSAADKARLDNMDDDANNYTHPNNHAPSIITQDANNRFVSDAEKAAWNGKAAGTHSHSPANINQDANNRFVSDTEKAAWNAKVDEVHRHNPSDIRTDELARFVSDTEKNTWNSKADGNHTHSEVTTENAGFMSSADKVKLNGVAEGANNYTHPTTDGNKHVPANGTTNNAKFLKAGSVAGSYSWALLTNTDIPTGITATKITQTTTLRFVSDTEKSDWNRAKVTPFQASTPVSGNNNLDCTNGFNHFVTLTGSGRILTLTNLVCGDEGIIIIKQNATGGWTFTFGNATKVFQRGYEVKTAANGLTIIAWKYEATATGGTLFLSSGIYE